MIRPLPYRLSTYWGPLACLIVSAAVACAVSPASVREGHELFNRTWTPGNPAITSDGLGPLFNGQSCVACHNQGGVGGGGAAERNAHTIGIEELQITGGIVNQDVVKTMLSTFHPGFILTDGTIINTLAMSHHGGSSAFAQGRGAFLDQLPAEFSGHGGPLDAPEVRNATSMPVMFHKQVGDYKMSLRARLYQRNTSSLFGAGIIDKISDADIKLAAKMQQGHPEISGRPATLRSARIGKFGWRGNVASLSEFTDQACANEVGLETRRKPQAADPMVPGYRNSGVDISDEQIEAMRDFIAALPAPQRQEPSDSKTRLQAQRGEQVFASVGCAVCHLPNIGPAQDIYSDILLHDMGYESMDLNHAEPYIVRITPTSRISVASSERVSGTAAMGGYYGPSTEIKVENNNVTSTSGDFSRSGVNMRRFSRSPRDFRFTAATGPELEMQLFDLFSNDRVYDNEFTAEQYGTVINATIQQRSLVRETTYLRVHYEPTNFNQEWRTPPLWGVRDSAPYMHDGRAENLLESIAMHGGEAAGTRDRFLQLPLSDRLAIISFLNTLAAPESAPAVP